MTRDVTMRHCAEVPCAGLGAAAAGGEFGDPAPAHSMGQVRMMVMMVVMMIVMMVMMMMMKRDDDDDDDDER